MTKRTIKLYLIFCILFIIWYIAHIYYYDQYTERMNTNNKIIIPKNVKIIHGNPPNYFYSKEQIDSILTKMDNIDGKIYIISYIGMGHLWYVKRDSIGDKISMFYYNPYDTSNELENFIKEYKYCKT